MSYSVMSTCFNCDKKDKCSDEKSIQEAVNKIHELNNNSHKGSGTIIISCTYHDTVK